MKGLPGRAGIFILVVVGISLLVVSGCRREKSRESSVLIGEGATPEEVVRLYQGFMDKNQFEQVKLLSTEGEQARLEEVRRIVMEETQDSTRMNSVFLALSCTIREERASCECRIRDEYETYNTTFFLVRRGNRWLVDVPEEEILFDEEEIKTALDSFFEQSKK